MTSDDAPTSPAGLDRPLGFSEAVCAEYFRLIPCGLQVVAAARLTVVPDLTTLQARADTARRRHLVLGSVLELDTAGTWWFRPAPAMAADVRAVTGTPWRAHMASTAAEPLDTSRSLWRVELVVDPPDEDAPAVLLVVGHHAAIDGMAAAALLRELLVDHDGTEGPLLVAAAMEDLLPPSEGQAMAPGGAAPGQGWPVEHPAPVDDRRLALVTRELDEQLLAVLHRRAHAERTTINAVLMAVLCDVHDELGIADVGVGFNIPADIRHRVQPPLPSDQMGAYFARPHVWDRAEDRGGDVWARARRLEAAFTVDLEASLHSASAWPTEKAGSIVASLIDPARSQFDLGYLLTNLAVVDLGPDADGLWFTTVQTVGVEALVVSAASVAGRLQLTVAWPEPLLSSATGTAVADRLVQGLEALCA